MQKSPPDRRKPGESGITQASRGHCRAKMALGPPGEGLGRERRLDSQERGGGQASPELFPTIASAVSTH